MKDSISLIQLLADGNFVSGEMIARSHGISRTMVWKRIQQLRERFDLQIHAVSGRGYKLAYPIELLDKGRICDQLPGETASVITLDLHHRLQSTNSQLMQQAAAGAPSGAVCLAEQQTMGRGRHGRHWVSPFGSNIYLSMLWRYPLSPTELSGLSLASGVAVLQALQSAGLEGIGLKWPNDILWDGRKVAGLLLEVSGETGGPSHVVVGVGINTRLDHQAAEEIEQPWVDLYTIPGGSMISRNQLAALLIERLTATLASYQKLRLAPYIKEWKEYDLYYGKRVVLISGVNRVEGIHKGIDNSGALLLDLPSGLKAFHAGEVSLRPVA